MYILIFENHPSHMSKQFLTLVLCCLSFFTNGQTVRKVLVEEFTGAWCGGCPAAALEVEDIEANAPLNTVALAWHEWDDLEIPEWPAVRDAFGVVSYPAAAIDRYKYAGNPHIFIGYLFMQQRFQERNIIPAIASIGMRDLYFDGNAYNFSVDMRFSSAPMTSAPVKFNVYITEDSIPATGNLAQTNYLSNLQGGANPLQNWYHNETVRRGLYGSWGITGPIPPQPTPTITYSQNMSFVPDPSWDISHLNLVAYLAYDGDTALNLKQVINAETVRLQDLLNSTGINEVSHRTLQCNVYPNPVRLQDKIRIAIQSPHTGTVKIELFNSLGKCISLPYTSFEVAGMHTFEWNTSQATEKCSPGIYQLRITTDQGESVSKNILFLE